MEVLLETSYSWGQCLLEKNMRDEKKEPISEQEAGILIRLPESFSGGVSFNIWRLERWTQAEHSVWKLPTFAKQITLGVIQCWIQESLCWLSEEKAEGKLRFLPVSASYPSKPINQ